MIRRMGDITADAELLLEEMVDSHDLQRGEILGLVNSWIEIHRPGAVEEYEDGTHPIFFYGPKD